MPKILGTVRRNPNLIPVLKNMNDSFENDLISNFEIDSQQSEKLVVHFLDGIEKCISSTSISAPLPLPLIDNIFSPFIGLTI